MDQITTMAILKNEIDTAIHLSRLRVTPRVICYLAQKATQVVPNASCSETHAALHVQETGLPSICHFVQAVVEKSSVPVPTLVTSLVYLWRLQSRLPPSAKGLPCTPHRIFLAALILAAKSVNDKSPMVKDWARYSAVPGYEPFGFSITEINLMERQFLYLLDWDLLIGLQDLHDQLEPLLLSIYDQRPFGVVPELGTDYESLVRAQRYPNAALRSQSEHVWRNGRHKPAVHSRVAAIKQSNRRW